MRLKLRIRRLRLRQLGLGLMDRHKVDYIILFHTGSIGSNFLLILKTGHLGARIVQYALLGAGRRSRIEMMLITCIFILFFFMLYAFKT
jgi:hypothetical protein